MKKLQSIIILSVLSFTIVQAQKTKIELKKVEPAFWWAGMKNTELQLLVYGENMGKSSPSLNYEGVKIIKTTQVQNPNYLFVYLEISSKAKAGKFPITFTLGRKKQIYNYELKSRKDSKNQFQGFNSADVIYLLMPDRFANGDPKNDEVEGMKEGINRKDLYGRHGGDLKGIIDNLDYIKDLGMTTLWLNPVLQNDQPSQSYHGYAITDFYETDERFGDNQMYQELANLCHQKGMKIIMDMVVNHCGNEHWFIKDLPMDDWIHQFPEFTRSNYRGVANADPYASEDDKKLMLKGWFDTHMADLNQANPLFATYFIQNSIWWIEYLGLDGIRMDTYSYPYREFLANWAKAIKVEYPNFSIVGEIWEYSSATQAYWLQGFRNKDGYQSNIHSITDFNLSKAINKAFSEKDGWDVGVSRLYYALAEDHLYPNANQLVTFMDNHDVPRFANGNNVDANKQKLGITFLLTTRGVPQWYYGTELLMDGNSHGEVRPEYPGGWTDHKKNVFMGKNLSETEKDILSFSKKILNWRKNKTVIHTGKLTHFVPQEGVYVYFRHNSKESVMVILNNNEETKTLNTKRFTKLLEGYTSAKDVVSGKIISDLKSIQLPAKNPMILELK